jgi:phospholipase/carboxylesterase
LTAPEVQHITSGPAVERLGLPHRVRIPQGEGPHPILVMVHGLDGTEDVTWVFARTAGPEWLIVSPRAPFTATTGYRWSDLKPDGSGTPDSFKAGIDALAQFIDGVPEVYNGDPSRIVLLGFSQGAATSYAYAVNHPNQVKGIAALSGFIPPQVKHKVSVLRDVPILILHGLRDETITIETARDDHGELLTANVDATYHESDVGHKVSSHGMAELRNWLKDRLTT